MILTPDQERVSQFQTAMLNEAQRLGMTGQDIITAALKILDATHKALTPSEASGFKAMLKYYTDKL